MTVRQSHIRAVWNWFSRLSASCSLLALLHEGQGCAATCWSRCGTTHLTVTLLSLRVNMRPWFSVHLCYGSIKHTSVMLIMSCFVFYCEEKRKLQRVKGTEEEPAGSTFPSSDQRITETSTGSSTWWLHPFHCSYPRLIINFRKLIPPPNPLWYPSSLHQNLMLTSCLRVWPWSGRSS